VSEPLPAPLQPYHARVEESLRRYLPDPWGEPPEALTRAMAHSLFAPAKRIRPILSHLAFEAAGGEGDRIDRVAAALEMIHTYSLIHDDLPCMDDDDLRRGLPSCHAAFGEALALLAGDALLTRAFTLLATAEDVDWIVRLEILWEVGKAAGPSGMIGGQVLDLEAEEKPVGSVEELAGIHRRKTGALLSASVVVGGLAGGITTPQANGLRTYGDRLGLCFQVVDDLLDRTGREEEMGKRLRKDDAQGKSTYPSLVGEEESRKTAHALVEEAIGALPFDTEGGLLAELARFVVGRLG